MDNVYSACPNCHLIKPGLVIVRCPHCGALYCAYCYKIHKVGTEALWTEFCPKCDQAVLESQKVIAGHVQY
jgi:hypothetical protein